MMKGSSEQEYEAYAPSAYTLSYIYYYYYYYFIFCDYLLFK